MAAGFVQIGKLLVIPQLGEVLLNGVAAGQLVEIGEGQFVLLLDPLLGGRRVGIFELAVWVRDLDAVVSVHLVAFRRERIVKRRCRLAAQG